MKKLIVVLVVLLVIIVAVRGCSFSSRKELEAAKSEADYFYSLIDAEMYTKIYKNASIEITRDKSETQFVEFLSGVKNKLGKREKKILSSWKVNEVLLGEGSVVLIYDIKFERGSGAETLIFRKKDGRFLFSGYNIQSEELVVPLTPIKEAGAS